MTFEEMARSGAHELSDREKFAQQGMEAISFDEHPLGQFCRNRLHELGEFLEFLQIESRRLNRAISSDLLDRLEGALALIQKIQLVIVPAAYALDWHTHQGQIDVIDTYIKTCLRLPLSKRINTRVMEKVDGSDERWRTSAFVWEALDQKRWLAADDPEAYIKTAATALFKQLELQADKEHIRAAEKGYQFATEPESGPGLTGATVETIIDYHSHTPLYVTKEEIASLPIKKLQEVTSILAAGGSISDAARFLGVAPKHVKQEVQRMRHAAGAVEKSERISFYSELESQRLKTLYKSDQSPNQPIAEPRSVRFTPLSIIGPAIEPKATYRRV